MSSSSSPTLERGLDTMVLVYSLLNGHPAATACEQFIDTKTGWFTSPLVLFEAKNVLVRVYGIAAAAATQKLSQFCRGPVTLLSLDAAAVPAALALAETHGIDLTDAVLLHLAQQNSVTVLASDDQRLEQAGAPLGIVVQSPVDTSLRQQIAAWEKAHLPAKGLPRILRRVHDWLAPHAPALAQQFWTESGAGSHLP